MIININVVISNVIIGESYFNEGVREKNMMERC